MNIATIQDLKVNVNKRLAESVKSSLVKIIENEFSNQAQTFSSEIAEKTQEILSAYKKEVSFGKLVKAVERARLVVKETEEALSKTGLALDGDIESYSLHANALRTRIDAAVKAVQPATNLKNKIISRMMLSDTYGEALVILREVMGNGVIPTLTKNDVKQIEYKQEQA